MNVLFILTDAPARDSYENTFTLNLFEYLALKHNAAVLVGSTIGSDLSAYFDTPSLGETDLNINAINFKEWDIIIVSNPSALPALDEILQLNQDPKVVYICHAEDYHGISYANKNILLALNIMSPANNDWLPKEKICSLPRPLFCSKPPDKDRSASNASGKIKVVHFVLATDDKLSIAKSIIVSVNCLLNVELTVVAPAKTIPILKSIANQNIDFVDEALWDEKLIADFNLSITSAYQAVKTLYFGIPTLVAGIRGLGGLVDMNNVHEHIANRFEGRIGGEPGELVPTLGIIELVMRFYEASQKISNEASAVAAVLSTEFSPKKTFGIIESEINVRLQANRSISSADNYAVKPYKISGARVIADQNGAQYLVDINNKVIKSVDQKEAFLLAQCDGEKTLKDIVQGARSGDPGKVRTFFLDLWRQNMLSFR